MIKKIYIKYKEIINYLIFGILTTIVSLLTYYLLVFTILNPNNPIEILFNSQVVEIEGTDKLSSISVENCLLKETKTIELDGLFIAIGRKPDTEILKGVELDKNGYIITNEKMETNIPGVYAAGDVRQKQLRQIVTACSDGAIASVNTNEYILKNF